MLSGPVVFFVGKFYSSHSYLNLNSISLIDTGLFTSYFLSLGISWVSLLVYVFWRLGIFHLNCWNYWHILLLFVDCRVILPLSFMVWIICLSSFFLPLPPFFPSYLPAFLFSSFLPSFLLSFLPTLSLLISLFLYSWPTCLEVYHLHWSYRTSYLFSSFLREKLRALIKDLSPLLI